MAQDWAGEERTRTFGLIQAAPYEYQKARPSAQSEMN
jgi:hypothetical protein